MVKNINGKNPTKSVAAGIVLFKPNFDRLFISLKNISVQISTVILYNNGADIGKIEEFKENCSCNIIIVGDGKNNGIASALNGIMRTAEELGIEWVLTLDQDSIVPTNLYSVFFRLMKNKNVAIVCSQNIDSRRKYMKPVLEPKVEKVRMCDTSGSCTNVSIWRELGGFDDWLFIDLVDNDFCKRVVLKGYRILRANEVIMDHQYGNLERRGKVAEYFFLRAGEFLHSTNVAKLSFKRRVNPMRVYFENRNIIYLNKKYKQYGGIGYANHHCKTYFGFFLTFSVYSWLASDKKREVYKAIINGIKDGKKVNPEPWIID